MLSGVLTTAEALSGFSNPAVLTIASLFVAGGAVLQTGLAGMVGRRILQVAGTSELRLMIVLMPAEALIKREKIIQVMRVEPESLSYHNGVANVGAILSGANNNGAHSANAITAIFIATGQDVANVSESSAGVVYAELTAERDLYISITIPSLIVATYGGGTGLATQKECLNLLGCFGKGKVKKFAEIIGGAVLAGELSLASAISSSDWVSSHEAYGRNR